MVVVTVAALPQRAIGQSFLAQVCHERPEPKPEPQPKPEPGSQPGSALPVGDDDWLEQIEKQFGSNK